MGEPIVPEDVEGPHDFAEWLRTLADEIEAAALRAGHHTARYTRTDPVDDPVTMREARWADSVDSMADAKAIVEDQSHERGTKTTVLFPGESVEVPSDGPNRVTVEVPEHA